MSDQESLPSKKSFRSISVTLFFSFFLLTSVVLFVQSLIAVYFNLQSTQQTIVKEQQLVAENAADTVENFIQQKFSILNTTAATGELAQASPAAQNIILNRLLTIDPSFRQIVFIDAQKKEIARASELSSASSLQFNQHISDDLFSRVIKEGKHATSTYIDTTSGEPIIILAVPVMDIFHDFKGYLITEVNLKFMWDLVSNIKVGDKGVAYVVDQEGDLLAYVDTSRVLKRENLKQLKEVSEFINGKDESSEKQASITKGINETSVLSTFVPLEGEPAWAVVTEIPTEEVYQPLIQEAIRLLIFLVIALTFAILVSVLLSKRITNPIIRLRDAAKQLSGGHLDTRIDAISHDEIGELSEAFNQMATQLKQYYSNLETEVKEKTSQLQKQMEETGRMNKLMVGRELRMVELKKENETLREKLGMTTQGGNEEKKAENTA